MTLSCAALIASSTGVRSTFPSGPASMRLRAASTESTSDDSASAAFTASVTVAGFRAWSASSPEATSLSEILPKLARAPKRAQVTESLLVQLCEVGFSGPTLERIDCWRLVLQESVAWA